MAAVIVQTLRPHVSSFGGELALHDAGLRALASSLVPDPRVRWSRLRYYAADDGWCIIKWCRQWQLIRRFSFWQSVVLCLLSSRLRRIEHQTRWTRTALWPRSVALRIRSLPHEVLLGQLGIGDAAETSASVHALLLDDPPRAVVTIDDDEDDFGTDIRMHEELNRVKMENSRLSRRCGRLRIKLASIAEDPRAVSTKCAHVNLEASLVPVCYDLSSVVSS